MAYPLYCTMPRRNLISHRGLSSEFPENTLLAFTESANADLDMVEFDVQITADDQLVVFHDADGVRMANQKGLIYELPLAAIQKWEIKGHFKNCAPQQVPTLEQTIQHCEKNNLAMNIEVKLYDSKKLDATVNALIHVLEKMGPLKKAPLISSFHHDILLKVRQKFPELTMGFLVENIDAWSVDYVQKTPNTSLNVGHKKIGLTEITKLASAMPIFVYTVNDKSLAQNLIKAGVLGVFTDMANVLG